MYRLRLIKLDRSRTFYPYLPVSSDCLREIYSEIAAIVTRTWLVPYSHFHLIALRIPAVYKQRQ
ncbi:MAG: hypothetical protein VKN72_01930 [Nostocales cyanobacterium 94392]|nr:hypothetical protein [Nostocales cyanobacterium 94392]